MTGISEYGQTESDISIFPVPVSGLLHVESQGDIQNVALFNILGIIALEEAFE